MQHEIVPYKTVKETWGNEEFENNLCKRVIFKRLSSGKFLSKSELEKTKEKLFRAIRMHVYASHAKDRAESAVNAKISVKETQQWIADLITKTWHMYRGKTDSIYLYQLRQNLHEFCCFAFGEDKAKTHFRFPFLPSRKLIYGYADIEQVSMDTVLSVLWHIRTVMPVKPRKRRRRTDAGNSRKTYPEALGRLIIELLWQGIPLKSILKLTPVCFDPRKRMIYFFSQQPGHGYWFCTLSKESYRYVNWACAHLREWQRSWKRAFPMALGDYMNATSAATYINTILRKNIKAMGLDDKVKITYRQLRSHGIRYKILMEDLTGAAGSSFYGPEYPTNTIGLVSLYRPTDKEKDEYRAFLNKNEIEAEESTLESLEFTNAHVYEQVRGPADLEPVWEVVSGCRKSLRHYEYALRSRVSRYERRKIRLQTLFQIKQWRTDLLAYHSNVENILIWDILLHWLIILINRHLSPTTVLRYMDAIGNILDYCVMHEHSNLAGLTTDDFMVLARGHNGIMTKSTLKNIKVPASQFFEFVRKEIDGNPTSPKIDLPEISWGLLQREVDQTPRMIEIASRSATKNRVLKLYSGNHERSKDAALVGLAASALGLREDEIADLRLQDVRIIDGVHDYLVVKRGKGAKQRRILLFTLDDELKKIFMNAFEVAVERFKKTGRNSLFGKINKSNGVQGLFRHYWKDMYPQGLHSMRHAFITHNVAKGRSIVSLAVDAGHSSCQTTQATYNQSSWMDAKRMISASGSSKPQIYERVSLRRLQAMTLCKYSQIMKLTSEFSGKGRILRSKMKSKLTVAGHNVGWHLKYKDAIDHLSFPCRYNNSSIPKLYRMRYLCKETNF